MFWREAKHECDIKNLNVTLMSRLMSHFYLTFRVLIINRLTTDFNTYVTLWHWWHWKINFWVRARARERRTCHLFPWVKGQTCQPFSYPAKITRDLRWIYAQSLPDLRVISTEIACKLGAIPEQIRRNSRMNPVEIAREKLKKQIMCL